MFTGLDLFHYKGIHLKKNSDQFLNKLLLYMIMALELNDGDVYFLTHKQYHFDIQYFHHRGDYFLF